MTNVAKNSGAAARLAAAAAAALALIGARSARAADRAIVVGVQRYPNLVRANRLQGCLADVGLMTAALQRNGFVVTALRNEQATKKNILGAFDQVRAGIGPGERFVFYFAGHGTREPRYALLPYDARDDSAAADLSSAELNAAVRSVNARSRTVILDSCFSGGMAKSIGGLGRPNLRARFYARQNATSGAKSPVPVNRQDTNEYLGQPAAAGGTGDVCYYTATMGNEQALEDEIGGRPHGVFTYYLAARLSGSNGSGGAAGRQAPWRQVHVAVKSRVAEELADQQHPTLWPAAFLDVPVFESKNTPIATPAGGGAATTLWDAYHNDQPDPGRIALLMAENQTSVPINTVFSLQASVGQAGYLVVLERFVDGRVYLLHPQSGSVNDARVVTLGPAAFRQRYQGDERGTEHVKAILFTSRDTAAALLNAFPQTQSGVSFSGMKRLRVAPTVPAAFFTSEIVFEITGAPAKAKR